MSMFKKTLLSDMGNELLGEENDDLIRPPSLPKDTVKVDELDLKILEALMVNANVNYTNLSKLLDSNEKAVSRRIERLIKNGVIRNYTIDINWRKLGFEVEAIVGIKTGAGEFLSKDIRNFFETQPRIVKAIPTIGAYEYILHTISKNPLDYRSQIGGPLEPLTADSSTSIIAGPSNPVGYSSLLNLVKENNNYKEKTGLNAKKKKRGRRKSI